MVEINATKKTLISTKIAISYDNEESFKVINKIITIFRWLKINIIFEAIEFGGDNYKKNIKTGITEDNLSNLKNNCILINASFQELDYDKNNGDVNVGSYLDDALRNLITIKYFKQNLFKAEKTKYLLSQEDVIENNDYYDNLIKEININNDENVLDKNISINDTPNLIIHIGSKYIIFDINHILDDKQIIELIIKILIICNLQERANIIQGFNKIDELIIFLKKQNLKMMEICKINYIQDVIYKQQIISSNNISNLKIEKNETQLEGLFLISEVVENIKCKKIKLPENKELYRILCNIGDDLIEVYPNINFWNDKILNPIIILKEKDNIDVSFF